MTIFEDLTRRTTESHDAENLFDLAPPPHGLRIPVVTPSEDRQILWLDFDDHQIALAATTSTTQQPGEHLGRVEIGRRGYDAFDGHGSRIGHRRTQHAAAQLVENHNDTTKRPPRRPLRTQLQAADPTTTPT